ncbi:unnamed protein product [Staurois parvus]|uniref:Uncharacterized protein n=1 Tax=Staurois parvus TaxID=386267 RepID=A0ABN9GQ96_9NEOB|nr:unnamed protein product [Staurois parvus]
MYASHAAARYQSVSWVPVTGPPLSAARARYIVICHGPRTTSLMLLHKARNLSLGPCKPLSCFGCQVPESVSWVPVRPPIADVSIATPLPCATFQVSSHCCVVSIFVIGCCMASHWLLASTNHTVAPHSGLAP